MGKPCSCTQLIKSLLQVMQESISILQVTRESISGAIQVTCAASERTMKSKVCMIKIITIVPSYTGKNITHLLPLALLLVLRTHNNTEGNKLVVFSGIDLYHGDTRLLYPISPLPLPASLPPDERNLLYVAATRAKKQLIISETLLDVLHRAKVNLSGGGFQSLLSPQYTIDHGSSTYLHSCRL